MVTNPAQHLRPLRARRSGGSPGLTHEAGRLLLLRMEPTSTAIVGRVRPGDPRRRCHAHQSAQDLFHAPRRRRTRRTRACGAERSPGKVRANAVAGERADGLQPPRARRGRGGCGARPDVRLPQRPDMGMYVRALAYMMSHGSDGLAQVACDAVLNANYITARLGAALSVAYPEGPCMHEALFDDAWLEDTGIATVPRFRQGPHRRGLPPHDHVFPAGRARGAMLIELHRDRVPPRTGPGISATRFCGWRKRPKRTMSSGSRGLRSTHPLRRLDRDPGGAQAAPQMDAAREPLAHLSPPSGEGGPRRGGESAARRR